MKKIGVITILNVNNYGAELQAFALVNTLKMNGFDAEIINYLHYKNPRHKKTSKSKPIKKIGLIDGLKELLYPHYINLKSLKNLTSKKLREKRFSNFHLRHTKMSDEYRSIEELYQNFKQYDVYIVGSDQVWNPNSNTNLAPYLLSFVKEDIPKISYASSFGVDKIDLKYFNFYYQHFKSFNFLSVREKSGEKIIKKITKEKKANWVLDPTFLLSKSDWINYQSPKLINKPYLLLYILNDSKLIKNLAKKIAKDLNLQIIRLCKKSIIEDPNKDVLNIIDAGPKEYIRLFNDASFIITTSFHGTCFSVNFEKPFFTILNKRKKNNSRIIDLLSYLELDRRFIFNDENIDKIDKSSYSIDFRKHTYLKNLKLDFSINYLLKSIRNEKI